MYMLIIAVLVAGPLIALFLSWVLALARRPRYHASPESKATPLGYWSAAHGRRVVHDTPGKRMYEEKDEETQKLEARK